MRPATVLAGDFSKRCYFFNFTEVEEMRLLREFKGDIRLVREVVGLDHVAKVSFSSSEQGFGLTISLTPGLEAEKLAELDYRVEETIGEVVESLMQERLAATN